jgi:hypothetical protein
MRASSGCLAPHFSRTERARNGAPGISIGDNVYPALFRGFALSIPTRLLRVPQSRGTPQHQLPHTRSLTPGPSTPQITAFAVICSGRDDRIEEI